MDEKDIEKYQAGLRESLRGTMDVLAKISKEIINQVATVLTPALNEFAQTIRKELSDLHLDNIDKDAIVENISKWGEYGWGILDFADFELYCQKNPLTCAEADKKAMEYCTEEEIENLITKIEDNITAKADFNDVINCYQNALWKPCAMLLFAIIDAMLIRFQPKAKDRRKTGCGAANIIEQSIKEKNAQNPHFLNLAHHLATTTAIGRIYENAKDFSNEDPDVINRHFVDHGMSQRVVTRTDCIKLLVILDDIIRIYKFYGFTYQS